jgi:hypothetical protein
MRSNAADALHDKAVEGGRWQDGDASRENPAVQVERAVEAPQRSTPSPQSSRGMLAPGEFQEALASILPAAAGAEEWKRKLPEVRMLAELTIFDVYSMELVLRELLAELGKAIRRELTDAFKDVVHLYLLMIIGLVLASGGLAVALATDKTLNNNLGQFFLGICHGMQEADLFSVDNLITWVEKSYLSLACPLASAVAFAAGAAAQFKDDVIEACSMLQKAFGNLPEIVAWLDAAPELLLNMLVSLFVEDLSTYLHEAGRMMGFAGAHKFQHQFLMAIDFDSMDTMTVAGMVLDFSFQSGRVIGDLVLELFLTLTGIGFLAFGGKVLATTARVSVEMADGLLELVSRLSKRVDGELYEDLTAMGAKIGARFDGKVNEFVEQMVDGGRFAKEDLTKGFENIRSSLGEEAYQRFLQSCFCSLKG